MNGKRTVIFNCILALLIVCIIPIILYVCTKNDHRQPDGGEIAISQSSAQPSASDVSTEQDVPQDEPQTLVDIYDIGDTISFGTFEQDRYDSDGADPIEWTVLDKTEDSIFIVSKYGLLPVQYYWNNTEYLKHTTWEESDIRRWLNTSFYDQSFTAEEQSCILTTHNVNADSSYGMEGGFDTDDKVFFLSYDETVKYFATDSERRLPVTEYAVKDGAFDTNGFCYWWLRTPGKYQCNAQYVFTNGSIYEYGSDVGHDNVCARPAMWVSMSKIADIS